MQSILAQNPNSQRTKQGTFARHTKLHTKPTLQKSLASSYTGQAGFIRG